jgi:host factor-I protein
MPSNPLDLMPVAAAFSEDKSKPKQLQDIFLTAVRRQNNPVTMFLVNGVMLQGEIAAYDLFCMLLQRDGMVQLVYKHAVSTVQPTHPLNLAEETTDDVEQ